MIERKYTVSEIDRMRSLLQARHQPYWRRPIPSGTSRMVLLPSDYREVEANALRAAEDQLRTYMLAGISPEELEASLAG